MDERSRAMIHDLMIAVLEGRETAESEPVPRTINVSRWNKAIQHAIKLRSAIDAAQETAQTIAEHFDYNALTLEQLERKVLEERYVVMGFDMNNASEIQEAKVAKSLGISVYALRERLYHHFIGKYAII